MKSEKGSLRARCGRAATEQNKNLHLFTKIVGATLRGCPIACFVIPLQRSSALLNPFDTCFRKNRGVYRTSPPVRSRWSPSAGDSSPGGKQREPFPRPPRHIVYTAKDHYASPPLARSPRCRHKMGSGIHRWAFLYHLAIAKSFSAPLWAL